MRFPRMRSNVRTYGGRATLRVIGYGALLSAFLLLGLQWEPHGTLMYLSAGTLVIVGPLALVLLASSPEVSRLEGWSICAILWTFLTVLILPVLRTD
jgi:hypothetical protein